MPQDIVTGGYPGGSIPTGGLGGDLAEAVAEFFYIVNVTHQELYAQKVTHLGSGD